MADSSSLALGILRKTPPADIPKIVKGLKGLVDGQQEAVDALTRRVHLPFEIYDPSEKEEAGASTTVDRPFLCTRYNRVGNNYRSPWTNKYYPEGGGGSSTLSEEEERLRTLEDNANEVWDAYRNLYYGYEAVGSVYFKLTPPSKDSKKNKTNSFQGLFGISKNCSKTGSSWNSIHLVQVDDVKITSKHEKKCMYRIESTVVVVLNPTTSKKKYKNQTMDISSQLSKVTNKTLDVNIQNDETMGISHLENIGTIIEDVEIEFRSNLELVHIPRTKQIIDTIQSDENHHMMSQRNKPNALMQVVQESDIFKERNKKILEAEERENQS